MAAPNPECPSFKKWRGVSARVHRRLADEALPPLFQPRVNVYVPPSLQDVLPRRPREFSPKDLPAALAAVKANDQLQWLPAVVAVRQAVSSHDSPAFPAVLESGVLPRLVHFLTPRSSYGMRLQLEAAWALTNVAAGTPAHCGAVVGAGAIAAALPHVASPDPDMREQAAWLLGNIAGDGPAPRDACLAAGVLEVLLAQVARETRMRAKQQQVWCVSNLTRFKPRRREVQRAALPTVASLVAHTSDDELLTDAMLSLFHMADSIPECVVAEARPALRRAAQVIADGRPSSALSSACKLFGALASCSDDITQAVLTAGALPGFARIMREAAAASAGPRGGGGGGGGGGVVSPRSPDARRSVCEACYALSNVAAGTTAQAAAVVGEGVVGCVVTVLRSEAWPAEVHREALWVLVNLALKAPRDPHAGDAVASAGGPAVLARFLLAAAERGWGTPHLTQAVAEALHALAKGGHVGALLAAGVYDTVTLPHMAGLPDRAAAWVRRLRATCPPPPPPGS